MEATKRRAGRPKAAPQTGPLVLEEDGRRVKIEVEIAEPTADELREYARWVELSSAINTADAMAKTVQYALREVFRRDRLWQQRRAPHPGPVPGGRGEGDGRGGGSRQSETPSPALPPAPAARPVPTPAHSPASANPDSGALAARRERPL
jgi:hypothetical protein